MAFRYIDPGYGALTGDTSVETFENTTYNPANGVSFRKLGTSSQNEMKIITPQAFTTDIYGKFNLYFDSTGNFSSFSIGGFPTNTSATFFETSGIGVNSWNNYFYLYDSGQRIGTGIPIKKKSLNSIWFHLHKDDEQKITSGELIVNDTDVTINSDMRYRSFSSEPFFYISFPKYNGQYIYLSEIIISDQYISQKENIIDLPIISSETNMAVGTSGVYIANVANQMLLQSISVSSLVESEENLAITGISIINHAYKIGAGLANLTALSKIGGSVVEHDTIALSGNSNDIILDSWGLSSIAINELQNMQFGWKVRA